MRINEKGGSTIKTIDELLDEVAKNLNVSSPVKIPERKKEDNISKKQIVLADKPLNIGRLSLDMAKKTAYAAELAAKAVNVKAVISIVNEGANLIYFSAMDDSYIASAKISQDKAYTAAALKMPTYKALEESRGGALDGLTNGNGIMLLAGGEPLFANGRLVGAIGVSGGTKDEDALIAKTAAEVFSNLIRNL